MNQIVFLPLFLGGLKPMELILILAVVLLLFGGKKIPELMRGIGRGINSFKKGLNEVEDEIKKPLEEDDKKA